MKKTLLLLFLVVVLATIPLITQKETEFGGADGEAKEIGRASCRERVF